MKTKLYLLFLGLLAFGFWADAGTITNGAWVGPKLLFVLNQDSGSRCFTNVYGSEEMIDYTLLTGGENGQVFNRESTDTPEVFFRQLPQNQSFEFRLFDAAGIEMPKTQGGIKLGEPVQVPKSIEAVTALPAKYAPIGAFHIFRPEDVFVMTNKGTYELELKLRIWAQTTNASGTNFEIIGRFDRRVNTNLIFGIVTSEPARVKIIKN